MVTIYDPLTNQTIEYSIDKKLIKIWDKLKDGKLAELNEDRVYLVDGRERVGKSSWAFQQAKYIDPYFNVDRICFKPDDFLNQIRTAPKGAVVVFDEAFRGLSSKATRSTVNKKIVEALMEVGQRNLVIFIVLPTLFLLEIYAAVFRSEALFHIYKSRKTKSDIKKQRAFKIYNYEKKKQLYLRGKTKHFSYALPKIFKQKGRFFVKNGKPYDTFDIDAYLKKKDEAFKSSEEVVEKEEKTNRRSEAFEKIIYKMSSVDNLPVNEINKRLLEMGIEYSNESIQKIVEKRRRIGNSSSNPLSN